MTYSKYAGILGSLLCLLVFGLIQSAHSQIESPQTVTVFEQANIQFTPDDTSGSYSDDVFFEDKGRLVLTTVDLPEITTPVKITAHLEIHPIPKDHQFVHDKWDRAGNIRLARDNAPDVEIVKFVTAYGGYTEYDIDVSHLAPLLKGKCTVKGFIDTWVSPAWKVDFSLTYDNHVTDEQLGVDLIPAWTDGVVFIESFNAQDMDRTGVEAEVEIPEDMERLMMYYYVSGHCTDGSGADEFVQKDNVIYVDDRVIYRFRPWRDDCKQFRTINPYCRRWSDGWWSSDYSRSGWCPGDVVLPVEIDLTDHLTAGKHKIRINIENIRPVNEEGNYGYWRVSTQLVGWKTNE